MKIEKLCFILLNFCLKMNNYFFKYYQKMRLFLYRKDFDLINKIVKQICDIVFFNVFDYS